MVICCGLPLAFVYILTGGVFGLHTYCIHTFARPFVGTACRLIFRLAVQVTKEVDAHSKMVGLGLGSDRPKWVGLGGSVGPRVVGLGTTTAVGCGAGAAVVCG